MQGNERFTGGLTVLMAVYKGDDHRLFKRAVESIYQNTLTPDHTVLVVDGPVHDEINEVVQMAELNFGVQVVRIASNQGLANALNEGLKHVHTEWVARADADDVNMPDRFSRQHRMIAESETVDLLGGAIEEFDEEGRALGLRRVPTTPQGIRSWIGRRNPFNHMTVVVRADIVKAVGGYPDLDRKEDYGLWAKIIASGGRCMNSDAILVRATAGKKMIARRGGVRYVKSEFLLQKEFVRLGISSLPRAVINGVARALVFLLPTGLRTLFYMRWLRSAPESVQAG
ncbi:MAG: glycosyltransferase [Burkholderiaceae bacterium]